MEFLFNFFVLYFLNFPSQITLIALVEFWFGLICRFLKKNKNKNLSLYITTNLNVPTNGLPLKQRCIHNIFSFIYFFGNVNLRKIKG